MDPRASPHDAPSRRRRGIDDRREAALTFIFATIGTVLFLFLVFSQPLLSSHDALCVGRSHIPFLLLNITDSLDCARGGQQRARESFHGVEGGRQSVFDQARPERSVLDGDGGDSMANVPDAARRVTCLYNIGRMQSLQSPTSTLPKRPASLCMPSGPLLLGPVSEGRLGTRTRLAMPWQAFRLDSTIAS